MTKDAPLDIGIHLKHSKETLRFIKNNDPELFDRIMAEKRGGRKKK